MNTSETWGAYRRERTVQVRDQLIEAYLHVVKYNAESIYAKLPEGFELDDLVSAGIFSLMDAIESYDPSCGVCFEAYCTPPIRKGILDELRSMDWVPRSIRAQITPGML